MIKDNASLDVMINPHFQVRACDVDENGNVCNVDIIIDGNLFCCFNMQSEEQCKMAIEMMLKKIWKVD